MKLRSLFRRRLLRHFSLLSGFQHKVRLRFTRSGMLLLGAALTCAVLGVNTRQVLIYQLFALCVGLLFCAWLWTLRWPWRKALSEQLQVQRHFPAQASVGHLAHFHYDIHWRGAHTLHDVRLLEQCHDPRPSPAQYAHAIEPGAERRNWFDRVIGYYRWAWLVRMNRIADIAEVHLPPLAPGASLSLDHTFIPFARGHLVLVGVWLAQTDPLGLMRRLYFLELRSECQVWPAPLLQALPALPQSRRAQADSSHGLTGDGEEFSGLRDYRAGDSLRMVHWKSFARLGRPVVKEFESEFSTRFLLVADSVAAPAGVLFEHAISLAAGAILQFDVERDLLDLLYIEQHCALACAGPGAMSRQALLHILSGLRASRAPLLPMLNAMLMSRAAGYSACLYIAQSWDEERRHMLHRLQRQGLSLHVWLVSAQAPSDLPAWVSWRPCEPLEAA
ncbi:DUF58 domain-containing protein [Massilia sp. W12]|uniref:DUF58 domain-containing protein n=1 Tax=Massilia sp. W12 TaxID=3126507 RepID=UPI0030D0C07C